MSLRLRFIKKTKKKTKKERNENEQRNNEGSEVDPDQIQAIQNCYHRDFKDQE